MVKACHKSEILSTLHHVMSRYGNVYCYPAQLTILKLLKKWYRLDISIATLNRHLRVLKDEFYMRRKRRIRRDKKLGMVFNSTMYWIRLRGYYLLQAFGADVQDMIDRLEQADGKKKPEKQINPEKDVRVGKMAPLKNYLAQVLKSPAIAEHPGSSK